MVGYDCNRACDEEVADRLAELLDLVTIGLEKTRDSPLCIDEVVKEIVDGICFELDKNDTDRESTEDEVGRDESEVDAVVENLLDTVAKKIAEGENSDSDDPEQIEENNLQEADPIVKGILKPPRCRQGSQHHVDFEMVPQFIRAYDADKDFTADIKFVEQHPKKVVSYRALYAAQKKSEAQKAEQDR